MSPRLRNLAIDCNDHAFLRRRALHYHCLGPWHEVVHGLQTGDGYVEKGLAGVADRLPKEPGGAL